MLGELESPSRGHFSFSREVSLDSFFDGTLDSRAQHRCERSEKCDSRRDITLGDFDSADSGVGNSITLLDELFEPFLGLLGGFAAVLSSHLFMPASFPKMSQMIRTPIRSSASSIRGCVMFVI
jgi:hypothetical protein